MDGEKSIIVAYDRNRVIGRNKVLPWAGQLPADMARFTKETKGKSVIMGRSTFESIPEAFRPLRDRQNIVLSRKALTLEGVTVAHSLEEAYQIAEAPIMVIGGESVYRQALPTVDKVYATEVFAITSGGDSFFPELPADEWDVDLKSQEFQVADQRNKYNYTFVTFIRKYPTSVSYLPKMRVGPMSRREPLQVHRADSLGIGADGFHTATAALIPGWDW